MFQIYLLSGVPILFPRLSEMKTACQQVNVYQSPIRKANTAVNFWNKSIGVEDAKTIEEWMLTRRGEQAVSTRYHPHT